MQGQLLAMSESNKALESKVEELQLKLAQKSKELQNLSLAIKSIPKSVQWMSQGNESLGNDYFEVIQKLASDETPIAVLKAHPTDPAEIDTLKRQLVAQIEAKHILQRVIENIPASVYWKDREGRYLGRNHYAAVKTVEQGEETTVNVDSVIGKTDYDLFDRSVADRLRANDLKVMEEDCELVTEEVILHQPKGNKTYHLSSKYPLKDANGKIIGIIGNTIDITHQKHAEQLNAEREHMEEKVALTQLFASSIAHELNNPLASIRAGLGGISRYLPKLLLGYKERRFPFKYFIRKRTLENFESLPERLQGQIEQALKIIELFLNNVKSPSLDSSQLRLTPLAPIVFAAIDDLELLEESPAPIEHQLDDNSIMVKVHPELTKFIFINLLRNACHSIQAANKGCIYLSLTTEENFHVLTVEDTGTGIHSEQLPNIFKPFESNKPHGTGLGLAYCKALLEGYGGKIHCESTHGEYTRFKLYFPK